MQKIRFCAALLATLAGTVALAAGGQKSVRATHVPSGADHESTTQLQPTYRIGAGDVLQINVYKEPDACVSDAIVRSDGKISVPFLKEVDVIGLTPSELQTKLTAGLARFINDPDVTVIVRQINSSRIYLVGAVKTAGAVDLKGEMTVLQAIAQAGGLTDYAKKKQIYVLRTQNGKQIKLPFNYDVVIKGGKMEQNIALAPNDIVVVPQ